MHLDGSIAENLRAAVNSAKRLHGHPVYADTLQFWRELLAHARANMRKSPANQPLIERLIGDLEAELAEYEQQR